MTVNIEKDLCSANYVADVLMELQFPLVTVKSVKTIFSLVEPAGLQTAAVSAANFPQHNTGH